MREIHLILGAAALAFSLLSALHAVLHKRDPRAALGWVAVCLWIPWAGPALYFILGVNRVRTHAQELHRKGRWDFLKEGRPGLGDPDALPPLPEAWRPLARLGSRVTRRPLLPGNDARLLRNGEEAYPAMLEAIEGAKERVYLSTYIFDADGTGKRFTEALASAHRRGVRVRVLVDAFGAQYSIPPVTRLLRRAQVPFAKFMPFSLSLDRFHPNLRNHRKTLLVDGQRAFTGGMNLGDRHLAGRPSGRRVTDLHFGLSGPIVRELEEVFLEDWYFAAGESIPPGPGTPAGPGDLAARAVTSGPNEDLEKLNWILLEALGSARESVRIITPYFVPDRTIVSALNAAALRGARVEVLLPEVNNLPFVAWAGRAMLWEMLGKGVRFFRQPGPFAHTKLMVVDGHYGLIGSSNWDARSFRLNFELDVETYGRAFAADLSAYFDSVRERSKETTLEELGADPPWVRLRDSFSKLFAPYL